MTSWLMRRAQQMGGVFDDCQMILQCGAPVFWMGCGDREQWAYKLWGELLGRYAGHINICNLAGGSCYPWDVRGRIVGMLSDADRLHMTTMLSLSMFTTVRDVLAEEIVTALGAQCERLLCPAMLASKFHGIQRKRSRNDGFVMINYMPMGGHYAFGDPDSIGKWKRVVLALVDALLKQGKRVCFVCHSLEEYIVASELKTGASVLFPSGPRQYLEVVSGASAAVCNRLHACMVLAGLGIPSVAIGNDTRLMMVQETGLPCYDVKNISTDILLSHILGMIAGDQDVEMQALLARCEAHKKRYMKIISECAGKS